MLLLHLPLLLGCIRAAAAAAVGDQTDARGPATAEPKGTASYTTTVAAGNVAVAPAGAKAATRETSSCSSSSSKLPPDAATLQQRKQNLQGAPRRLSDRGRLLGEVQRVSAVAVAGLQPARRLAVKELLLETAGMRGAAALLQHL